MASSPLPPLSLYLHVPWCVRKCPYCDFNSHTLRDPIPEERFVAALLADLEQELALAGGRPLASIFIGGGTPSLLSGAALARLLAGVSERSPAAAEIEITLEANPGTAEAGRFAAYRDAGVNRLSLGLQSLTDSRLAALGRIHGAGEGRAAVAGARAAGFDNLNLDLMFALPGQDLAQAREDVLGVLELAPEHISYYQLTIEPNTGFHAAPPALPDEDLAWTIQDQGQALLADAGFTQYEVSAYARPGRRCRHNLNYWTFGDYLGVGPGAHGKLSRPDGSVERRWKRRGPAEYLAALDHGHFLSGNQWLSPRDRYDEFLLNALRLRDGFPLALFERRTGLPAELLRRRLGRARALGLVEERPDPVQASARGYALLNDLLALL